ncbi:HEAT repeat domain-containing protein [Gemmatimonas sp.]|jgi:HEAT repeat protein|uniref:HEAT repeat domain-containing protein n=1 Tax=Gemmatimonas sp. TaxID=1962908 RepID=UPI0037BE956B
MPPLGYRRLTPSSSAAESGVQRAVADRRAARGSLRSLALLVDRLATLGVDGEGALTNPDAAVAVRDALRQFTGRIREAPMECRVVEVQFILACEPVDRALTRDDPLIGTLLVRCMSLGIGAITVRQGAAPGELLTLASLLAQARTGGATAPTNDTPTSLSAINEQQASRELLRSWSVQVMPAQLPAGLRSATPFSVQAVAPREADDRFADTAFSDDVVYGTTDDRETVASSAAQAFGKLAAAHDDLAATKAADVLIAVLDTAEFRGEARVLAGTATAVMIHMHTVSTGAGRLAVERVLRRLQHRSSLELLATRIPHVPDRTLLLELLSRAGETIVDILVKQLMEATDAVARRAYFDSIVGLDLGGTLLFEQLRDPRWYVVRNAAALLGELGVEQSDSTLLPLLQHDDERIRVATARALVRLGTAKAINGLHAAIDDSNAEVRRIAAVSYGLTTSAAGAVRPHAARLAMALDKETDEDVALEMLASLGKLGSADAVQRLLRIAMPQQAQTGDTPEKPREAWLRIAALEALVRARGQAVMPHVQSLTHDTDTEVAQAAFRLSER